MEGKVEGGGAAGRRRGQGFAAFVLLGCLAIKYGRRVMGRDLLATQKVK